MDMFGLAIYISYLKFYIMYVMIQNRNSSKQMFFK